MKKILIFLLILASCTPIHLVIDDPAPQLSRAVGWQTMRAKQDFKDSAKFEKLSKFIDGVKIGNDISGSDIVVLDSVTTDGTNIYFYTGATILTAVPGTGSAAWGAISGSLPNQTDLNTALDLKANLASPTLTGSPIVPGYVPTSTTVNSHPLSAPVVITASDVGLGNVDNTSDANKPISTLTQNALNAKQATLESGTNIKTVGGTSLLGTGDIAVGGTGTVTNVSVTSANGVSGSVATSTTTPAITLTLGAITPSSVGAVGTVTGSNLSGTNTGDNATNTQYSGLVSNATHTGDATGSTALTVVKINGVTLSGLATGILKNTTGTGVPSIASAGTDYVIPAGNVATATKLAATKTINGIAFDGSTNITVPSNIVPGTVGNVMLSNGSIWTAGTPTGTGSPVLSSSPALTDIPTAPTAAPGTNTTQIANTAFTTTADNLKLNVANPTATGTLTTPILKVGNAASNTITSLDSISHVTGATDINFFDGPDTLYNPPPFAKRVNGATLYVSKADSANGSGAAGKWVTGKDYNTDKALLVPYTGATTDLTLGAHNFTSTDVSGQSLTITATDTTVTAVVGRIVFKTSNLHFYGCKQLTGKKWYQLDN